MDDVLRNLQVEVSCDDRLDDVPHPCRSVGKVDALYICHLHNFLEDPPQFGRGDQHKAGEGVGMEFKVAVLSLRDTQRDFLPTRDVLEVEFLKHLRVQEPVGKLVGER